MISQRPGRLHLTNQLIGGMRIRQQRVAPQDCDVNAQLQDFYARQCRSSDDMEKSFGFKEHYAYKPVEAGICSRRSVLVRVIYPLHITGGVVKFGIKNVFKVVCGLCLVHTPHRGHF